MQPDKDKENDLVFGIQSVLEALKAEKEIEKVFLQNDVNKNSKIQDILDILRAREIPYQKVPIEKLNRITRKNHQGAIAFITPIRYVNLANVVQGIFEQGKNPLILILDRITDVRNFGAISRTAEVAGVDAIVVPLKGSAQIGSDAMKTSSGALNFIPICREVNLNMTIKYLEESGLQIIACTEKAQDYIYDIDFNEPTALIMGSEEDGISPDLLKKATRKAKIPVQGQIGSLNVSVATGVVLFEVVRQRRLS
jgi:23S rRNA (guanosine2251-2'-O)-methyltransferase